MSFDDEVQIPIVKSMYTEMQIFKSLLNLLYFLDDSTRLSVVPFYILTTLEGKSSSSDRASNKCGPPHTTGHPFILA